MWPFIIECAQLVCFLMMVVTGQCMGFKCSSLVHTSVKPFLKIHILSPFEYGWLKPKIQHKEIKEWFKDIDDSLIAIYGLASS